MTQYKELGKNQARVDARDKVTGRATYAADIYLPGMIWCKVKGSTRRHARITNIDISNASKLPGVREIICGSDFPDAFFGMGGLKDHRVMARDHVFYIGEPVAAVAADDEVTAAQAVGLIEVTYEDIDAVIDPLEAVRPEAALVHPEAPGFEGYGFGMGGNINILMENDRGDVDGAFRECVHVFEDTYRSQSINQGFLEPMACVANLEPTGRLTIWASTQGPYQVRSQLASVLEMPVSKIKVVPMELGGGFGAKLRLNMEAFPALLAIKTGRPVKLVNTREEVFTLSGPRLPTNVYLKTGVAVDGTILAREGYSIFDMGAYQGPGPMAGVWHAQGPYSIPNIRLRAYGVYTNKIYAGSYRASGVADITYAVESHMDMVARRLGIDPVSFREKNLIQEGHISPRGMPMPRNGLKETVRAVKERLGLPRKQKQDGIGIGIAVCEWQSGSGPSYASVAVQEDGTVSLLTGSVDISGSDTALAQITAETLGIATDSVIVSKRDTDTAPYTHPSGGSRITYSQGKVAQQAAEEARDKLLSYASEHLGVERKALVCDSGRVYVGDDPANGVTIGQLASVGVGSKYGPVVGQASLSSMPYAPVFTTHGAEVAVDKETGHVRVTRYVQAQDVGIAINPMAVEGQLEGGVVQGIGRALTEEVIFDSEDGHLRNPSLSTYLMPLAIDMPEIETILISVPSDDGPFGARAVAEPPGFGPPAAIANAIEDAVGVRITDLPLNPERVLKALNGEGQTIQIDVESLRDLENPKLPSID